MGRIISILQNKGGVGKSTVTCNLAAAIVRKYEDKKVLIVDIDGQGNQAISFGLNPDEIENTIYDVLLGKMTANETIQRLGHNLDLIAANDDMNYFELDTLTTIKVDNLQHYFESLKRGLDPIRDEYDYIFIDSPPELKIVAAMVMMVTDDIYIPFEPDAYNAQGLIRLLEKLKVYKDEYGVNPEIKGVIPMKVKKNTLLHRGVLTQVDAYCHFNDIRVLDTKIPYSIQYPSFIASARMPIVWADSRSSHAIYYYDLAKEVVENG